jgi:hypothetical protein
MNVSKEHTASIFMFHPYISSQPKDHNPPNILVEWLALLLHILEVSASKPDPVTGYPE